MKNSAKAQAVAFESASALSTDDLESVEPIIAVGESDRLTPMSIKEATTRYANPSLFLLDKHTLNRINPSKVGLRNRVRSTLGRFLWRSYAKYPIFEGLQIKLIISAITFLVGVVITAFFRMGRAITRLASHRTGSSNSYSHRPPYSGPDLVKTL